MAAVLLVIHIFACVAMVIAVMLQRSEGGALGMGGGGTGGFISGRGVANVLVRTTMVLAAVFFVTSLTMTRLDVSSSHAPSDVKKELENRKSDAFAPKTPAPSAAPAAPAPSTTTTPAEPGAAAPITLAPAPATPDPLAAPSLLSPAAPTSTPATSVTTAPSPAPAAPSKPKAATPARDKPAEKPAEKPADRPASQSPAAPAPAADNGGQNPQ